MPLMRLLLCFFILMSVSAASAQELSLTGNVLEEAEHDRTLISKPGWLRGLHIVGTTPVRRDHSLMLAVVPGSWTELCAQFTSIGGDYSAIVEFDSIPVAATPRSAELKVFAKSDVARNSSHQNGGVVLEKGSCTDDRELVGAPREYTASFWNVTNDPALDEAGNAKLVLNMNVARADEIRPGAAVDGVAATVACTMLVSPEALAFNYQCSIDVPAEKLAQSEALTVDFSYERFYRGRIADPRRARIFVGALRDVELGANQ